MKVKQLKKLLAKVDDNAIVLMDDVVSDYLYGLKLSQVPSEKFFILTYDSNINYESDGETFVKAE